LPLADERAELVGGEVEAVEVGQAVLALDLVDAELDLAEGVVLILLQVGERDLEYPALEGVVCVLQTRGAVDEGLADTVERTQSVTEAIGEAAAAEAYSRTAKVPGALTLYQSFFAKTSVFFLRPFFPFERRLFLPTAMFATLVCWASSWCCRCRRGGSNLQMVDSLNASVVRASDNGVPSAT
jgi:hypothetical protein